MPLKEPNKVKYSSRFVKYWDLFLEYKERRDQTVRFISKGGVNRNIIDYVKDSVDRMNEYHIKPNWKEDWQQNVFDPKTRDKVIAILSRLASARMKPEVLVKSGSIFEQADSKRRERIYNDLLEASSIKNKDEEALVWEMYTALSEGSVFGFESWKKDTVEREYVKEYDPDTGEIKTEKIKYDSWDDVWGEIVPLDEIYPETIWTYDFDNKIKRLFWVQELTVDAFNDKYGKFKNSSNVKTKGQYIREDKLPWGISNDIDQNNIQVIHFYDEVSCKMGIWANTEELYWGAMPWNHGKKPFWMVKGEPIHHQFLYGKSMPDKLMGMQDIDNAVLNGMLDQLFLSLNSPTFIDGNIDLDEGYLEPGRLYEVDPGTKVSRVPFGQNDNAQFQMLSLIQRSMEESSVSAQNQGVPSGGRKTKYEVQQLQEGAINLAGMFLTMMEQAIRRKYWLRMYNIIQYYSMPSRDKNGKEKFKFIKLENRQLSNGKIGKKLIQIADSPLNAPSKAQMTVMAEKEEGKPFDVLESRVEPIVVFRDYFLNNNLDLDIKIVPNSSIKDSQAIRDNKTLVWYQNTAGDPMIDQIQNKKNFAKAMGQPEDLVKEPQPQPQSQSPRQDVGNQPAMPQGLQDLLGGSPEQQLNQV